VPAACTYRENLSVHAPKLLTQIIGKIAIDFPNKIKLKIVKNRRSENKIR